jgi:hypothetical protein
MANQGKNLLELIIWVGEMLIILTIIGKILMIIGIT